MTFSIGVDFFCLNVLNILHKFIGNLLSETILELERDGERLELGMKVLYFNDSGI